MPAMLEDPTAPAIYRVSGQPPYPTPSNAEIPPSIQPRQVTLRDRITIASLLPFSTPATVPPRLLSYLCSQLNHEIEKGDTYPMMTAMHLSTFGMYWFQNFGAIMLLGEVDSGEEVGAMEERGVRWEEVCLGSFYVKPNYPGRSSHVCNGGFLVTEAARNRGVGRLMGEGYLEWAPKLGYTYSVFNLVYETNVASCRIWDALGFKRVGRIPNCGNLASHPSDLVDAIIYGRSLGADGEDFVSEERFDKIRYYLKHGTYPSGADRAEKSRLRSAATHYKLVPIEGGAEQGERLMLKDKEVVSDPQRQYEIAREVHVQQHGGINKTTATIAEKFHWVRIKETVSLVIKNCPDCKEAAAKVPTFRLSSTEQLRKATNGASGNNNDPNSMIERIVTFDQMDRPSPPSPISRSPDMRALQEYNNTQQGYPDMPVDPQIMQQSGPQHHFVGGDGAFVAGGDGELQMRDVDMRMATERHVREGNEPLKWGHGDGRGAGEIDLEELLRRS